MTPDETLKQMMDAIQVKCGDGYLDALHALLGLFSLHEEGKGMPHGLPYTAAQELLDACKQTLDTSMCWCESDMDEFGNWPTGPATDSWGDFIWGEEPCMYCKRRELVEDATPPVEQGEET